MDKSKKYLAISFIVVLIAVIILSFVGMFLLKDKPVILQGQIEATEIRIYRYMPSKGRTECKGRRHPCCHQQP